MVLVLDGNSEIGAHVRSNLFPLFMFKAFGQIESISQIEIYFISLKRPICLHACATCFELPSHIGTMVGIGTLSFTMHSSLELSLFAGEICFRYVWGK